MNFKPSILVLWHDAREFFRVDLDDVEGYFDSAFNIILHSLRLSTFLSAFDTTSSLRFRLLVSYNTCSPLRQSPLLSAREIHNRQSIRSNK